MKSHLEALIARFEAGGELLKYAVGGLTEEQAKAHPGPGEWSIAEVAAHLADCDLVASDRMKRVLAEENPSLLAFDENAWLTRLRSGDMPVDESAALFDINRKRMGRILRGCSEQDFGRAGIHSERGRTTLAELLTVFVNHLDHHLKFIFAKRANLGISIHPRYTYDPL
jgi:hypothetical protein